MPLGCGVPANKWLKAREFFIGIMGEVTAGAGMLVNREWDGGDQ